MRQGKEKRREGGDGRKEREREGGKKRKEQEGRRGGRGEDPLNFKRG